METENDSARAGKSNLASNPSLPYLMGCCCLGLILFGIATTIVMALIPTYLPSKAEGLSRSNYTSWTAQLQAEAAASTSRKRQSPISLTPYVGCEFSASGREQVRQLIRQYLSPHIKDVSILSVAIANRADNKKKRMALDRDARQTLPTIIYDITMIFMFRDTCPMFCQTKAGATQQQMLYNIPPSAFDFSSVPIMRDGSFIVTIPKLRATRVSFVSSILSAFSPFQPGAGPATRGYTANIGG